MRNNRFLYLFFGIFILALVVLMFKPVPTDWKETYDYSSTIPGGTILLREQLGHIAEQHAVEYTEYQSYTIDFFDRIDLSNKPNVFIIQNSAFTDSLFNAELMNYIYSGGTVIISGNDFSDSQLESINTLDVHTTVINDYDELAKKNIKLLGENKLELKAGDYSADIDRLPSYYSEIVFDADSIGVPMDTLITLHSYKKEDELIAARFRLGDGQLILNTLPTLFTNYRLLTPKSRFYSSYLIGQLDLNKDIVWVQSIIKEQGRGRALLSYMLSEPSLYLLWHFFLFGLVMSMLFGFKRIQRPIAIIEAPKNATKNFIVSLSKLFYGTKNHFKIFEQRLKYFNFYLRKHFNLKIDFKGAANLQAQKLVSFTKISKENALTLIEFIQLYQQKEQISSSELKAFNKALDQFYNLHSKK